MSGFPGLRGISNLIDAPGDLIVGHKPGFVRRLPVGESGSYAGAGCFGRIFSTNSIVNVAGTAVQTTLGAGTVPGGALGANRGVRLTIFGLCLNNTGSNQTFRFALKYGATTLAVDATIALASSAGDMAFKIVVDLHAFGATALQVAVMHVMISGPGGATAGSGDLGAAALVNSPLFGNSNEDSTADKTLEVAVQPSAASADLSITAYNTTCEAI